MGVIEMPVRFKYQICVSANEGLGHKPPMDVQCPRVGECLCMTKRQTLEVNLKHAQQALDEFDEAV